MIVVQAIQADSPHQNSPHHN